MKKKRIKREKITVSIMVGMYCRHFHQTSPTPCAECKKLLDYAFNKIDRCPYQKIKPVCSRCRIHCYSSDIRDEIKKVMRYSGPKMLLFHPMLGVLHLIDRFRPYPEDILKKSRN